MSDKVNTKESVRKRGVKELILGVVVAAAGGLATLASYNSARPGGTYTVYTGFIALGVVYAIKGLLGVVLPNMFLKNKTGEIVSDKDEKAVAEADIVKEED